MAIIGLLTVAHPREDLPGVPRASLMAGGITLLERNVRLLRRCDTARIYVLADVQSPKTTAAIENLRAEGQIDLVPHAIDLASLLESGDRVVMIEEGVLLDTPIVAAVTSAGNSALAVWPSGSPQGSRAVRIDAGHGFGSVLMCRADVVRTVCKGLGDWDLEQTLLRAVAGDPETVLVDLETVPLRDAALHRDPPLLWQPMSAHPDEAVALDLLVEAAQRSGQDWPGQILHPPLENAAVRALAATPVMPVHVLAGIALMGLAVSFLFAHGLLWLGVALVLLIGPLEGVQEKLARVQSEPPRFARWQFWLMLTLEFLWYAHLALHFSHRHGMVGPWVLAAAIFTLVVATLAERRFFSRVTGITLEDAGGTENKIQLLGGQRRTFFWLLLPFGFFGHWYLGFAVMAAYAVVTFFAVQERVQKNIEAWSGNVPRPV
jgi:1L-myo-inositol 1-phosphate cytidylyltransferase / CDP-L-myo-inositol myo-inositolphosphotransferase